MEVIDLTKLQPTDEVVIDLGERIEIFEVIKKKITTNKIPKNIKLPIKLRL
jgi:hypothetical protein